MPNGALKIQYDILNQTKEGLNEESQRVVNDAIGNLYNMVSMDEELQKGGDFGLEESEREVIETTLEDAIFVLNNTDNEVIDSALAGKLEDSTEGNIEVIKDLVQKLT